MSNASAPRVSLEDRLRETRHAIVIGVGGGGDVVGALPSARLVELFGASAILGGLSWERSVHDPEPGPRRLAEVRDARAIAETVWHAGPDTATHAGVRFAESEAAAVLGADTLLVDPSHGVRGLVDGLRTAVRVLDADLLVGVDVGGDSLAVGDEPGLRSPLADAMVLAAIAEIATETNALWGVIGYGSDGELTVGEVDAAIARIAGAGGLLGAWGVTPAVSAELARLVERVGTEASALVLRAARGERGETTIRRGTREVVVGPACTVTFYLDPAVVASLTPLARAVAGSDSLEEANEALHALGIRTELDLERERRARGET